MAGSAEGASIDPPSLIISSSTPSTPQEGYNAPSILLTVADDGNNGSSSAIIQLVRAEGTTGDDEDGSLLVFGTRPQTAGGAKDPKEGLRIGRNQFVGAYYKPGATQSPPAMLTVGTNLADRNTIGVRETSATPTTITNYGQIYVKSSDKKVYFMDSSGFSYDLTAGGTSVSVTPSLSQVLTAGATASSNIDMSNYSLHKVTTIKSADNTAEIQTINMINASLLNLMYNT
jgi:hypothetical protein